MTGNDLLHLSDTLRKERREHPMDPQYLCYCAGEAVCPEVASGQRCREGPVDEPPRKPALTPYSEAREAALCQLATAAHGALTSLDDAGPWARAAAEALREALKAVEDASK